MLTYADVCCFKDRFTHLAVAATHAEVLLTYADVYFFKDRFTHLAVAAARMAVDDSALDLSKIDKTRFGCYVGSAFGGGS